MGETLDERSDLFSLGIVLFEMCTGHVPYVAGNANALLQALQQEPAPAVRRTLVEAPEELDWIIQKAFACEPAERYQSAKECLADLRRLKQRVELTFEQQRQADPPLAPSARQPLRFETRPT